MNEPDPAADGMRRFFGGLLMAVGGLIAILCGLCSLFALVFVIPGGFSNGPELAGPGLFVVWAIIGLLPTLVGVIVFWLGQRLYLSRRTPPDVDVLK